MAHLNITKFFNNEAKSLIDARSKCIEIHGSDIRAAGNEVEIAVRQWLSRMLPHSVSIGHGHIIDSNSYISPQLDCIIRDEKHLPTLFTAADGTEYTPIDSVFSYGEVKSTYYKASKHIKAFAETKKKIREEMTHELIENTAADGLNGNSLLQHVILGSSQKYLNQIFTFMLFIDSGDADTDDLVSIYSSTDDKYLPDVAVFLNKWVIVKGEMSGNSFSIHRYSDTAPPDARWQIVPAPRIEESDATIEGKHLGFLYYCLLNHIKESQLDAPNLAKYMRDLLIVSKSRVIQINPNEGSLAGGH